LRGVVERLGGTIQYDAATRVITGGQANLEKQSRLRIGSDQAFVNGQQQTLDTPARHPGALEEDTRELPGRPKAGERAPLVNAVYSRKLFTACTTSQRQKQKSSNGRARVE
jgi:hypothetical protein